LVVIGIGRLGRLCVRLGGRGDALARADREDAGIKPHRELPLLLLRRVIDQGAELSDELLGGGITTLGVLDRELVLAVTKSHDLDEPPAGLAPRPVGADLFEDFEVVAAESVEDLAEAPHQSGVLGALFLGDDVAVGLQKH